LFIIRIFGKFLFLLNWVAAFLLIISFILPYLSPSSFPNLSVLSLAVPPLLVINSAFAIYWLVTLRKRFWLSLLVLVIAYFHFDTFLQFSFANEESSNQNNQLSVLSFNVRLFNRYEKEVDTSAVNEAFRQLINSKNPDVVLIQEYYHKQAIEFARYPYKFIHYGDNNVLGHAILSKYPLINKGAFDFKNTYNNSLYADAIVNSDTLRIYNIHLQSFGILPSIDFLQARGTDKIKKRLSEKFMQQENQVEAILEHKQVSPYPVILGGDFNNTSFSFVYQKLKEDMQDCFNEKGKGLGTTFFFYRYPMRIDFLLADEFYSVLDFEVSEKSFSDHKPILTTLGWD